MPVQPGSLFVLDGQQRLTSIFRVDLSQPHPQQDHARSRSAGGAVAGRGVAGEPVPPALEDAAPPDERRPAGPRRGAVRGGARRQREPGGAARAGRMADRRATSCSSRRWIAPTRIRMSILQAEVIAYEIDADANDDNVIEIFARLNQQGVRLRPGDLAAARLTGQMTNFRTPGARGAGDEGAARLLGARRGRGRQPQRRVRRHGSADPRGAVPGRRRRPLPRRREAQARRPTTRTSRRAGTPRSPGSRARWRCFATPAFRAATGSPTATCCFRRRSRRRAATSWTIAGSGWAIAASLWRHYAGEVDTKLAKDAGAGREGRHRRPDRARQAAREAPRQRRSRRKTICSATSSARGRSSWRCSTYFMKVGARSFPSGKLHQRHPGAAGGAPDLPARAARSLPGPRQRIRARPARQPDPARPLRQRAASATRRPMSTCA